jgi:hypothetical protein
LPGDEHELMTGGRKFGTEVTAHRSCSHDCDPHLGSFSHFDCIRGGY